MNDDIDEYLNLILLILCTTLNVVLFTALLLQLLCCFETFEVVNIKSQYSVPGSQAVLQYIYDTCNDSWRYLEYFLQCTPVHFTGKSTFYCTSFSFQSFNHKSEDLKTGSTWNSFSHIVVLLHHQCSFEVLYYLFFTT